MAVLDSRKVLKNLKKKGFTDSTNKSDDHIWLEFIHDGKLTRSRTKISHNGQDIDDFLISAMSKQINLDKKQFISFAECTLDEKGYIKILKSKNLI